jgi:hypothetical protein
VARVFAPATSGRPLLFGAVGGSVAGAAALAVGMLAAALNGHAPLAEVNAVGAWFVRWLQTADWAALNNFYADATVGGAAIALLLGALGGAVFGGALERLSDDSPVAWGLVSAAVIWAAARWVVLPALDPALGHSVGALGLAAMCVTYGLVLGFWQRAGRAVRGAAGLAQSSA